MSEEKRWLFKPGQSGNPGGRPSTDAPLIQILREMGEEVHPIEKRIAEEAGREPLPTERAIAERIVRKALLGDPKFIQLYLLYVVGKPKATISIDGKVDHTGTVSHEHGADNGLGGLMSKMLALREKALEQGRLPATERVVDAEVVA